MNESIKCTECGGNRCTPMGFNTYRCEYCGVTFSVKSDGPSYPAPPKPAPPVMPQAAYNNPYNQPNPYANPQPAYRSHKDKTTALILTFFLGGLGVQWFYLGRTGMGVLSLLFFWTWIPAIIAFVQFIILLCMSTDEFDRKYNM